MADITTQTPAVRNQNPGNLKDPTTGQFRKFSDPLEGKAALYNDLTAKMTGTSTTGINGSSSLIDFAKVYAPASDKNDPVQYAANIANKMGISPDTQIGTLMPRIDDFASAIASNEDPSATYQQHSPLEGWTTNVTPEVSVSEKAPISPTVSPETSQGVDWKGIGKNIIQESARPFEEVLKFGLQKTGLGDIQTGLMGNEIKNIETPKQAIGDVIEILSWGVGGKGALQGYKALKGITPFLQAAKTGAKDFGIQGAMQGFGQGLGKGESTKDAINQGLETGLIGSALGAATGPLAVGASKIFRGTVMQDVANVAKQKYINEIDSKLGKYGKGTGETLFDFGVDHNQTGNDAAYQLRTEIAAPAEQKLTEVLREQNLYTPVKEWVDNAIKDIKKNPYGGNTETVISNINNHVNDVLTRLREQGLVVTNTKGQEIIPNWALNEAKQANWQNAKYTRAGDPLSNSVARANVALGRSAKGIIEDATKGLDVEEYNRQLGRIYKAADELEKRGERMIIPEGTSHVVAKFVGAIAGSHAGIIESLMAAKGADIAAGYLNELPRILWKTVAEKMNATGKGDLFREAEDLVNKLQFERKARPLLESPKAIQLGGKTAEGYAVSPEGTKTVIRPEIALTNAPKYPTSVNPKTGKFQKMYKGLVGESPLSKGAIPETALEQEAIKYKTPEEFIKSQGTPVYHGTPISDIKELKPSKNGDLGAGVYLTRDKNIATDFSRMDFRSQTIESLGSGKYIDINTGKEISVPKPGVIDVSISGLKIKVLEPGEYGNEIKKLRRSDGVLPKDYETIAQTKFKDEGYDGIELKGTPRGANDQILVFPESVNKLKTKSQLTDIWNKAHGKTAGLMAGGVGLSSTLPKEDKQKQISQSIPSQNIDNFNLEQVRMKGGQLKEIKNKNSLFTVKNVLDAIANNETNRADIKDPYSFRKSSGVKEYGEDLGKYQITTARLNEKGKLFLGRKVTPDEFINSPALQERFIRNEIMWLHGKGLTPEQIIATHRNGWGSLSDADIKNATDERKDYVDNAVKYITNQYPNK